MLTAASGKPLIGASYSCPLPPVFNINLFENQIIDREADEEHEQVAVPEAGERVVERPLVRLGLAPVLFADAEQVLAEIEKRTDGTRDAYEDEYDCCEHGR